MCVRMIQGMELLGGIERKLIYYIKIRDTPNWGELLPTDGWVAFTIANTEDRKLVPDAVKVCLDKNMKYSCSAGTLAHWTEQCFDEEIVQRAIAFEIKKKEEYDYDFSPMTTAHQNFSEGFWFASTLAYSPHVDTSKVVCLDFTKRGVKNHLVSLIHKINENWLPNDEEVELAKFDI